MSPLALLCLYGVVVLVASCAGGWLPTRVRFTHRRMQAVMSLVAGLMLGVALFHMLPHAVAHTHSLDRAVYWLMGGLLGMFFLIRAFHFHQHEPPPAEALAGQPAHADGPACGHDHGRPDAHRWLALTIGLGVHTFIDGIALGSSVVAEAGHGSVAGIGTFLAIVLHKPLDAMAITSLMRASGRSTRAILAANVGFGLICPIAALLFHFGVGGNPGPIAGAALAFSAGVFLCISLSDLLPEVQFHNHDRIKLSALLLIGVALAWAIGIVEGDAHPGHGHGGHDHGGHDHSGHDHDHD